MSRVSEPLNVDNLFGVSQDNMKKILTRNTICQFSNVKHKGVDLSTCRELVVNSANDDDDSRLLILVQSRDDLQSKTNITTSKLLEKEVKKYKADELSRIEFVSVACPINKQAKSDKYSKEMKCIGLTDADCFNFFCPIIRNYYLFADSVEFNEQVKPPAADTSETKSDGLDDTVSPPPKARQRTGINTSVPTKQRWNCNECGKSNPQTNEFCQCGYGNPEFLRSIGYMK